MKKIAITLFAIVSLTSCSNKGVYEVRYYKRIDFGVTQIMSDFIFVKPQHSECWDWYKETPMFEEYAPSSDSVTIEYWGTMKRFREFSR